MPARVCAKCGDTDRVVTCTLSAGAETVVLHLCHAHAAPVVRLIKLGGTQQQRAERPGTGVRSHAVIPID